MKEYQKRVVAEKRELAEKIEKLIAFYNDPNGGGTVSEEQLRLLKMQEQAMLQYLTILEARIGTFE